MKRVALSIVLALALLAVLSACSACAEAPDKATAQVHGVVTAIDGDPNTRVLRVVWDASLGERLEHDAASVSVPRDAAVFARDASGEYRQLEAGDLRVRDVVEIQFTGPVRESYPVQATAKQIVVVGQWDASRPLPEPPGLQPPAP